jgi:4-nitrophenyl phosphatase
MSGTILWRAMTNPFPFHRIRAILIDLDGVLYRGSTALPAASEFIQFLRERGIAFRLITNNATLTPPQYMSKLQSIGIPVEADELFTSALATGLYMKQEGASGSSAYVIGEDGLRSALIESGMRLTEDYADWVVVGLDRQVTYDRLAQAALAVQAGARFVGSNPDLSFPTEVGLVPGAGALQTVISATTGVDPVVIGKPQPLMFELAIEQLGSNRESTAMLGDRLDTDIQGAQAVGLASIMVLTGVSTRSDLENSAVQPTLVVDDLPMLIGLWKKALEA